jgi:hypothetical protein
MRRRRARFTPRQVRGRCWSGRRGIILRIGRKSWPIPALSAMRLDEQAPAQETR